MTSAVIIAAIARFLFPMPEEEPFYQVGGGSGYNDICDDFLYFHLLKINACTEGYEIVIWRCDLQVLKTCSKI